ILTGTNSSGKSSLIQSILLSGNHSSGSDIFDYLNSLGDFNDLKNRYVNPDKYNINITFDDGTIDTYESKKEQVLSIGSKNISYPAKLTYLNSNRTTIEEINSTNNSFSKDRYFGIYGKFIANYFEVNKDEPIEEYLIENKNGSFTLEAQVNYWLNKISTQSYEFKTIKPTSTVIQASYKLDGLEFKPNNIGAGVSYTVAILVAILSAKKGNIIIVENPEIHLHPQAQAMMGEFLSFVASKGIQLIVETHNDHLINKIRYEVYKQNLKSEDIIIHYKSAKTKFEQIYIKDDGFFNNKDRENSFPSGFYDATIKDIFEINSKNLI
ncbi:AAA family ATPase, partial [Sulfurimonas sp.]|uniref:AAA family ATPase n=1 Tax=Sulfurimonas sp. TaxID=2022749 RepID=UPI0039E2A3CB